MIEHSDLSAAHRIRWHFAARLLRIIGIPKLPNFRCAGAWPSTSGKLGEEHPTFTSTFWFNLKEITPMRTTKLILAVLICFAFARTAQAHCEVPCGIYGDQTRFVKMLEDQATIAKAITQVGELAESHEAQDLNQLVRWVTTKEDHATKIQHTIAQYFMTQRIKATGENYTKKLTAAHAVMVAAMKCKQSASADSAEALKKAIYDFYRAYEGKEPHFHD